MNIPYPRRLALLAAPCLLACFTGCRPASQPCAPTLQAADPQATPAILDLLHRQQADWNRGDLQAFATGYKNSPDILFMGSRLSHGYAQMLEGYRKAYPTPQRMGQLSFTELQVQPVSATIATATGHFHLQRPPAQGGEAQGFFLLVLEQGPDGWKIIRDDTTPIPAPAAPR